MNRTRTISETAYWYNPDTGELSDAVTDEDVATAWAQGLAPAKDGSTQMVEHPAVTMANDALAAEQTINKPYVRVLRERIKELEQQLLDIIEECPVKGLDRLQGKSAIEVVREQVKSVRWLENRVRELEAERDAATKGAKDEHPVSVEPAGTRRDLREKLADYAHQAWSRWMKHLFGLSLQVSDGSVIIPADNVVGWRREAETDYADQSNVARWADRDEADKVLAILDAAGVRVP